MKVNPSIHFNEFCEHESTISDISGFKTVERNHPEFGLWKEQTIDLGHIRVFHHQANFKRQVNVRFDDGTLDKYVHHCISLDGEMGAHFLNHNVTAKLSHQSYHQVFVPEEEYVLGMVEKFTNVHIEVERTHYAALLSDTEEWSANLRKKLFESQLYYPGEFKLSQSMMRVIHEIFNSPLTGYLKRVLIEAKVHELIALQLNGSEISRKETSRNEKDLFVEIKNYLDRTYLNEHSLKSIARQFGLNEFTLKKGFKTNYNTTVFDYLLTKRLEHAHELLLHTTQSIREISLISGYKYSNHFSTAFKKRFGISPFALRA